MWGNTERRYQPYQTQQNTTTGFFEIFFRERTPLFPLAQPSQLEHLCDQHGGTVWTLRVICLTEGCYGLLCHRWRSAPFISLPTARLSLPNGNGNQIPIERAFHHPHQEGKNESQILRPLTARCGQKTSIAITNHGRKVQKGCSTAKREAPLPSAVPCAWS